MKGEAFPKPMVEEGDHLIAEFAEASDGPTLIAVSSIHGNEPAGLLALRRVSRELKLIEGRLRGRVYFLAGNTRALVRRLRFVDADLNRYWTKENLSAMISTNLSEDRELAELEGRFSDVLKTAGDEVFVLDLHTTSAGGAAFATVGDTLRNRRFAQRFPVTILLGIEEQLTGTLLEYLNNRGAVTLGFEGGQHDSAEAIENHTALVWLGLVNAGLLDAADVPNFAKHQSVLRSGTGEAKILEVRHREAITPEDDFRMKTGFQNFEPILKGQFLASNRKGPIRAVESGLLLMPLYQKLGEDGFFIGREVAPFWLWLSGLLRRLRFARVMPWLPGVRRHPTDGESLIVNTRIARVFPLQIFHLLGFRRRRWENRELIVSRRCYDIHSPFTKETLTHG